MKVLKGQTVRLTAAVVNTAGAPVDPTTIRFVHRPPGSTSNTTWTYPADVQIVKDSTGNYHVDFVTSLEGTYYVAFETVNPTDADETSITVVSAFR